MSDLGNEPDLVLQGNELPTFRFALEKSEGKALGGSYGKEGTVKQLPISKGIAGVSMRLEPGVLRELHWHATAGSSGAPRWRGWRAASRGRALA